MKIITLNYFVIILVQIFKITVELHLRITCNNKPRYTRARRNLARNETQEDAQ